MDRDLARPSLQPPCRRRESREQAHRHALHGQRDPQRHRDGSRRPTACCACGGTRVSRHRRSARRRAWLPAHWGTSGTRFPTTATRPPGLIRLSDTTVPINDGKYLLDYGSTYGNGTARHSLTMYKAASGALVFSAGTVRWPYGLATENADNSGGVEDVRMQQATVNLFADMGAQPGTIQSGLTLAVGEHRHHAPHRDDHEPGVGRDDPDRSPVHDHRYRHRLGWPRRRSRALVRRWCHLAAGNGSGELVLRVDAEPARRDHDPGPRHRRQPQRADARSPLCR